MGQVPLCPFPAAGPRRLPPSFHPHDGTAPLPALAMVRKVGRAWPSVPPSLNLPSGSGSLTTARARTPRGTQSYRGAAPGRQGPGSRAWALGYGLGGGTAAGIRGLSLHPPTHAHAHAHTGASTPLGTWWTCAVWQEGHTLLALLTNCRRDGLPRPPLLPSRIWSTCGIPFIRVTNPESNGLIRPHEDGPEGLRYTPRSRYSPAARRWPWPAGCPSRDLPGQRQKQG